MMNYIPARLVKGKAWYIVFYAWDPVTDKRERFRQSFDLNRIQNPRERLTKARLVVAEINKKLPSGYPFTEEAHQIRHTQTPIEIAVRKATEIKCTGARQSTVHSYQSIVEIFIRHLQSRGDDVKPVIAFTKYDAIHFLDAMNRKGIGARTHNNYVRTLKVIFNALVDRQYITINPWVGIPKQSQTDKARRCISLEDARIIITEAKRTDQSLCMAIMLQYHCFIRPNELRSLRVRHIDTRAGVIRLPGSVTKNKRDAVITIPDAIQTFIAEYIQRMGKEWYLFGHGGEPGPSGPVGANTMGHRHMKLIRRLKDLGALGNIEGVSFYSWKDTGVTALIQAGVPVDEVMRQLRHTNLATTQVYMNSLHRVNEKIKNLESALI